MKIVEPPFKKRKLINGNEEIVNNNTLYNSNRKLLFSSSFPNINKNETTSNNNDDNKSKKYFPDIVNNIETKSSYVTKIKNTPFLSSDIVFDGMTFPVDKLVKESVIYTLKNHNEIEDIEECIKKIVDNITQYIYKLQKKQTSNEYSSIDMEYSMRNNSNFATESEFDSSFMNYGSEYNIDKSVHNIPIIYSNNTSNEHNNILFNSQYYDKFGTSNDSI